MKYLIVIISVLTLASSFAQRSKTVKNKKFVFVSNDYKKTASGYVFIKFFTEELKYSQGFNVYRKKTGTEEATKINKTPIVFLKNLPSSFIIEKDNLELYEKLKTTAAETINKTAMGKAIIKLKAVSDFDFAYAIGQAYIDSTAQQNESYQYIIKKIVGNTEVLEATSGSIKVETWKPLQPPSDIKFEKDKQGIKFSWIPEPINQWGVVIFRKRQDQKEFIEISPSPISPKKKDDGKYAKFFYTDLKTSNDTVYFYKLASVDYFGQKSLFCDEIKIAKKDFDAPIPPDSLLIDVDTLSIKMKWKSSVSPDLAGYNVYRSNFHAKDFSKVNAKLIPKSTTKYIDKVPKVDEYFYYVSSVDSSGNEDNSITLMADVRDVIAPEIPKNFKGKIIENKIILTWDASPDKDLKGYVVYKSPQGGQDFVNITGKTISETKFEIPFSKKSKTKYIYKIQAIDSSFNKSAFTPTILIQLPDIEPPAQPFIKNITTENDKPKIIWMPNVDNDLKSYALFRTKLGKDTTRVPLNTAISKKDTLFKDLTAESNENYKYVLYANDSIGNVSLPSTPYSFKIVNTNTLLKVKKMDAKYDKKEKTIAITWTLETDKNYYGCVLFRAFETEDMAQYTGKLVNEVIFIDKNVKKTGSYSYQLRVYDKIGNVIKSDLKTVNVVAVPEK